MTALFILALIAAVVKLWIDLSALRHRVRAMELGITPRLVDFPTGWGVPTAAPEPPRPAWPEPAAAPPMTARVVHPAPEVERETLPLPVEAVAEPDSTSRHSRESGDPSPVVEPDTAPEMGPRVRGDDEMPAAPATPTRSLSFEDIFGRKLPIWAGGVTLAVCGFLIVKYSIEAGLLSPLVRVIGGLLFGSGLIAGAEFARQNAARVREPRVAQALSGAGIATFYATTLVAANLYHLIPPLAAFLFMAATTVLAGALSIRFGAPSAVLGLVGGLAAPALVGSGEPNVPLLAAYLSLAVGGLATLGRAQRWWWLGVAAIAGGFGWGMLLILNGALGLADSLSIGAFLLLLGVGLPVLLFGGANEDGRGVFIRLAGMLAATAQLAALVATGGFTMLNWSLFGLLGLAAIWLSRREKPLADLPAPALLTALLLMAAWPHPTPTQLAIVFGGAAAIFGLPAAWRSWTATWRMSDIGAVCALAVAPLALALFHFDPTDRTATLLALLGAAIAGVVAAAGWRVPGRQKDSRFALLTGTAALLAAIAAPFAVAAWVVAPVWAVLAATLLLLSSAARDPRVGGIAWAMAGVTMVGVVLLPIGAFRMLERATGLGLSLDVWEALRWSVPMLVAVLFAMQSRNPIGRGVAAVAAVLLGYVAAAQVTPAVLVPLLPVLALAMLGWFRRSDAATVTAAALAVAWAAWPLLQWLAIGGGGLVGLWVRVDNLPSLTDTATRLLAPMLAGALLLWRHPPAQRRLREGWLAGLALLGAATAHIAYKQLFALASNDRFVALGLAERTLWEALLALAAVATWRRWPMAARALGLAALTHFAWFTLLLHDPLWDRQMVGALPVANLLLPAYGLGFVLLWLAGRIGLPALAERARGWGQMLLILLFAASELRQLVHGSILVGGGLGQAEDIARSIVAVGIAVGFLVWGIHARNRDWRIASLVVMLGAVLKVFLLDTSGLDGLIRIASFAALGFSLIGIGWLYSRYLPDNASVNPTAAPSA